MNATLEIDGRTWKVDLGRPLDISIPLDFRGAQPNAYGVPPATAQAYEDAHFVGDTRRGGSCNFETCRLIPHCNGTHTECVGHISYERISVHTILQDTLVPATLVTVASTPAGETGDTYRPPKNQADRLVTREALQTALSDAEMGFLQALVIRTLPNDPAKRVRRYLEAPAPYFSVEAMQLIVGRDVQHLLVDLPSVDRAFDEGRLTAHHLFWQVPEGGHDVDPARGSRKTITEMIYVPDEIPDGRYVLNLQIPDFVADAAPSRVRLFRVQEI